ncbi:MAG: M14 family metallopeptidase, partial [Bacteroidia bacterium]|nr:M14 family metallopeptidase [Bacteroidia bacterium]
MRTSVLNTLIIFIGIIVCCTSDNQKKNDLNITEKQLLTYCEKSGYKKIPRYEETVAFCKQLADNSTVLHYTDFGTSPQGRKRPLIIADKNGNFDISSVKLSGNVIIMIIACIHSGECEGKDAGLMLLRDIAFKKCFDSLLEHVTILFIPIFNVDGHERFGPHNRINQNGPEEMGWRTTANNFNLNRDFLKADAPEMQAWLKLFTGWLPDFIIDCHTTDGADYQYAITYDMNLSGNMDSSLTAWVKNLYLHYIETKMNTAGYPIFPYVYFRDWHDPRSGLAGYVAPPRLSEGYAAIQNRPAILLETHMLKNYKTRVSSTYEMLKNSLEFLNVQHKSLKELINKADQFAASKKFREKEFPLTFFPSPDSTLVDFLGIDYTIEKSDLTGGSWFKYNGKPKTFRIPYFCKQIPVVKAKLPEAYIIPPEWKTVIERLDLHGISYYLT